MYIRFPCFILLLGILLVIDSRGDTSGPLGIWYLNSNSYPMTATITAGSQPGAYRGTLVNENRGTEQLDNISWNEATRRIEFRRIGNGFWQLNNDGSLTRLNDSANAAGAVSEVSLLALQGGNGGQVVTSVRDSNGRLKLIVWNVTAAGVITRLGDSAAQAGVATMIRSAKDSHGHVITSVRTAGGTLKLISWSVSANGNTVTRLADSGGQAGQIGDNALMSRPGGLMVSAVRTAAGRLKLICWAVAATGVITRSNDSANQAGTASLITLCPDSLSGNAPIVTAVRTASNSLKLITWGA